MTAPSVNPTPPTEKRTPRASVSPWIPIAAFLVGFALAGAELRLPVTAARSGQTQVFFASFGGALSEGRSALGFLSGAQSDLRFPLPLGTPRVRWDPLNGPGDFTVDRPSIEVPLWSIRLDPPRFSGRHQILALTSDGRRIQVTTTPDASDPAVGIELPWLKIILAQLGIALAFAILAGLFTLSVTPPAARDAVARLLIFARAQLQTFQGVPLLALIAAAFWFLSLSTFSISVDDELAMFRQDQGVWVAQGRWATYLLTRFILPQPVVPFMVHALFCVLASAAYVLLLRAHGMASDRRSFFLFPVFAAFPVWFFIGEFYGNFFSAAVGLVLTAIAAAVFHAGVVRQPPIGWRPLLVATAISAVFIGTAMGAYQSFVLAFGSIGLGVILFAATRNPLFPVRLVLKQLGALGLTICAGGAFYAIVSRLFRSGLSQDVAYIDEFLRPALLLARPLVVVEATAREAFDFYGGSAAVYGAGFGAVGALMVLGTVSIARSVKGPGRVLLVLLISTACLGLPFALSLVAGGALTVPFRSLVGVPYVVWLFGAIALHDRRIVCRALTSVALVAALYQVAFLHSSYSASVQLSLEHDKALAGQIYRRVVEKLPDFNRQARYNVDLHGAKSFASRALVRVPTSTIGRSFFDWDGGNADRILIFMRIVGYDGMAPLGSDQRRAMLTEYATMPMWPAEGSVRRVGDAVLVKLGDIPGSTHQFQPH